MFFVVKNGGQIQDISDMGPQYNGDKVFGENDCWETYSTKPNEFIRQTYGELCKRNTTLYHTFGAARACVNKPLSYIIGDGLRFKSAINPQLTGMTEKQAVDWSMRFSQLLHYAKLDIGYYEKQSLIFRQACISGDCLVYFLREGDGRPFDIIVANPHEIDWERDGENTTLGVKTDKFSRPIGFYRKGKEDYFPFKDKDNNQNAILFFLPETAGQLRGMGCFYSEIARAKGFDRVWDATIERMVMESVIMGYFANDNMDGAEQLRRHARNATNKNDPNAGTVEQVGGSSKLKPGNMLQFNNQGSMKFNDLKTPSKNFGDANQYYMSMFAMARGYPKSFIMGEYDESYSAGRSVLNDSMKKVIPERGMFINKVDKPVNLEFLKHFAANGMIEVPDAFWTNRIVQQMFIEGVHIGPVPAAINPLQESMADKKNVDEGFDTREIVARKKGNDWENMKDDWKKQNVEHLKGSPVALLKKFEADLTPTTTTEGNEDEDN